MPKVLKIRRADLKGLNYDVHLDVSWEGHNIRKTLPILFDITFNNVKKIGRLFQIFEAFLEYYMYELTNISKWNKGWS